MIIDNIKNYKRYTSLHKNFQAAFDFIQKALKENLSAGKYEIDGEALFAVVQEYETHPAEGAKFEGHRKYIDLQFIAEGYERMALIDITSAEVLTEYDEAIEAAFFAPKGQYTNGIFTKGDFAIFWPQDLHQPGLRAEADACFVKKIIVKIEL